MGKNIFVEEWKKKYGKEYEKKRITETELTKDRFAQIDPLNILAVTIAEPGAMGSPGQIIIAEYTEDSLEFLYTYDFQSLLTLLPWVSNIRWSLDGSAKHVDPDWRSVDLGMGNHMLILNAVWSAVKVDFEGKRPSEIYGHWRDALVKYYKNIG